LIGGDGKDYYTNGYDISAFQFSGPMTRDFFPPGEFLVGVTSTGGLSGKMSLLTAAPTTPLASRPTTSAFTLSFTGAQADTATAWSVSTVGTVVTKFDWSSDVGATPAMAVSSAPVYRQTFKTAACNKGFIGYYTRTVKNMYNVDTTQLVGLHGADNIMYPLLADSGAPAFKTSDGTKVLFKAGTYLTKVCATGGTTTAFFSSAAGFLVFLAFTGMGASAWAV
jgi:hypothetical protein